MIQRLESVISQYGDIGRRTRDIRVRRDNMDHEHVDEQRYSDRHPHNDVADVIWVSAMPTSEGHYASGGTRSRPAP